VKIISKEKISSESWLEFQEYLNTLRRLDHPNVIKATNIFEDKKYMHVVMEYVRKILSYSIGTAPEATFSMTFLRRMKVLTPRTRQEKHSGT